MSSDAEALLALSTAPIDIEGRMPNSSNATFLVQVGDPDAGIKGIYKPLRGERPLCRVWTVLHRLRGHAGADPRPLPRGVERRRAMTRPYVT